MMLQEELTSKFKNAILEEQKADMTLTETYLKSYPARKLAKLGLAITNLLVSNIRTGLGGKNLIELIPDNSISDEISQGSFKNGDIVRLDRMNQDNNENSIEGVVTKVKSNLIVVSVDDSINDEKLMNYYNNTANDQNRMWIVQLTNSITYQRMTTTMNKLNELANKNSIIQLLLGETKYTPVQSSNKVKYFDENLNDSQKDAINFAINQSNITIIHGPPGTGKTYTLIEIIKQLTFNNNEKVLVCGGSNISVDTILERLSPNFNNEDSKKKKSKKAVSADKLIRIGHPARLLESNLKHSLEVLSKTTGDGSSILSDIEKEINETIGKAKKSKRYAERRELWKELKLLRKELRSRERKVVGDLLMNAQVILSTLHGAGSYDLNIAKQQGLKFDTIIIDEVSQSLEPQCWIPIVNHCDFKRLIIAGDNKQLSPVLKTDKSGSILVKTLFDRLVEDHEGAKYKKLLNIQYRMNQEIMKFSSKFMYQDKLKAHESVAGIKVSDLKGVESNDDTEVSCIWYDTQGGDFNEKSEEIDADQLGEISGSKYNEMEILVVLQHIEALKKYGVGNEQIGVISPYNAQVSRLRKQIRENEEHEGIEISTVDGFQGREKEIIIMSLVRSNETGQIGFLKDERRLNVAITRPKRQLCIVGDLEILSKSESKYLKELSLFVEDNFEVRYPDLGDY